ncbi:MAG: tRNA (N(6)-L-threonylcarbamoyladenosine(37)-C(2))-methylthiotransferase MtaB [Bacillota bacterium]
MAPKVGFYTLGCKVNQYDTQVLIESFRNRGFEVVPFDQPADVYVVNSCAVTQRSVSRSKQALRSALRRNPRAVLVMTGCFPQVFKEEALAMAEVAVVSGTAARGRLVDMVEAVLRGGGRVVQLGDAGVEEVPCGGLARFEGRTRAFLKVQEGCEEFCSYCVVPYARGPMRSRPAQDVLAEAKRLAEAGCKEVVLTGTHLAAYRWQDTDLSKLLEELERIEGIQRIRLSSVEPLDVHERLIEVMAKGGKVCHHLHLPLQSGSDEVLRRMNRKYDTDYFRKLVRRIREAMPDVGITTDVMVGFPGETEEQFLETMEFVRECAFSRLHVFRFSPRPGTPAAQMPDQVDLEVKGQRASAMISLGRELSLSFASRFVGRVLDVLVEEERAEDGGLSGFTGNYIRVSFPGGDELVNRVVPVEILVPGDKISLGRVVPVGD